MHQWLKNVAAIVKGIGGIVIMILAEDLLPALHLYGVAERIVRRRYAERAKPAALERALSGIYEKAGKLEEAERRLRQAVVVEPTTPDNYLFLGQFLAKHNRTVDAIRAFEQATNVAQGRPADLEFAQKRIEELRRAT
jgi:hypothetical protein